VRKEIRLLCLQSNNSTSTKYSWFSNRSKVYKLSRNPLFVCHLFIVYSKFMYVIGLLIILVYFIYLLFIVQFICVIDLVIMCVV
jgi:hypothetical protein